MGRNFEQKSKAKWVKKKKRKFGAKWVKKKRKFGQGLLPI